MDMMVECVAEGARIGTVAFFAVVVFALLTLALYGLFAVLSKAAAPEKPPRRRHRNGQGF